jgi:hypothetical protein
MARLPKPSTHISLLRTRANLDRNICVAKNIADAIQQATGGTLLGSDGLELKRGIWESCVYLGMDGFVYEICGQQSKHGLKTRVVGKRAVGDYLRWVDGLFRPGELPDEANAVHYRAARMLRELL